MLRCRRLTHAKASVCQLTPVVDRQRIPQAVQVVPNRVVGVPLGHDDGGVCGVVLGHVELALFGEAQVQGVQKVTADRHPVLFNPPCQQVEPDGEHLGDHPQQRVLSRSAEPALATADDDAIGLLQLCESGAETDFTGHGAPRLSSGV